MYTRRLALIVMVLVLVLVLGAIFLLGRPRLLWVSPDANTSGVPASAAIQIHFSRLMQPNTVTSRITLSPDLPGSFAWQGNTLIFNPKQPWPSGETITVSLAAGARAAGLISLASNEASTWSFTIGSPRLAYLYPADAAGNIYLYNSLTGLTAKLTDSTVGISDFHVSQNGESIYFSIRNTEGGSDLYHLRVPQASGAEADKETPQPEVDRIISCLDAVCRAVQISPDGDFLAYERTALLGANEPTYSRIWVTLINSSGAPEDGGEGTLLPLDLDEPFLASEAGHQASEPFWSPGRLLTFYDSQEQAFVFLDPVSRSNLVFPNQTGQPGDWDPEGNIYVAAEISFPDPAATDLALKNIASSHLIAIDRRTGATRDLTEAEYLEDTSPAFSPDGKMLAFARKYLDAERWTPGRQLWLMLADGSQARPLTDDPYYQHFDLTWSPDGKTLAYVRFNQTTLTEPPEVWLIDPVSGQASRLVVGGYAPQWVP